MKQLSQYIVESFSYTSTSTVDIANELGYVSNIYKNYDIESNLKSPKSEILYCNKSSKFLIAAPHHASDKNDIKGMRTERGTIRSYDANTGFICLEIAKSLGASYLIYNNAKDDPNKVVTNEYCHLVKAIHPKILVEIHGHAEKSIDRTIIEVSGGLNNNDMSIKFANILTKELHDSGLSHMTAEGDFNKIFYKGSKTATVNGSAWNGSGGKTLHIELPKHLRLSGNVSKIAKVITKSLNQL